MPKGVGYGWVARPNDIGFGNIIGSGWAARYFQFFFVFLDFFLFSYLIFFHTVNRKIN
jgi:hypothetical protein